MYWHVNAKKYTIVGAIAIAAVLGSAAMAAQGQELSPGAAAKQGPRPFNLVAPFHQTVPTATAQCFTCGGDWPIFIGSISSPVPATGNNVTERGAGCADPLTGRRDGSPFLCSR
jgi:hypothetical protein